MERETAAGLVARPDAGEPDREPRFETAPTERAGDRATEAQLHRAFLARDPAELALVAEDLLRGATRAPEQVALLRALLDRPSSATEELFLCALRDLPHDARPGGESVPSTALLLLDRRAARDPLARGILRRAAFERPHAPGELRHRAAASFLPHADEEELLACRTELTREPDARFLECALEALSRNPHAEVAAILLAPHGREPVSGAGERTESP